MLDTLCALFKFHFLFKMPPPASMYTLSLHDALPIYLVMRPLGDDGQHVVKDLRTGTYFNLPPQRSEEHTSELQSRFELVCRLRLEKKNGGLDAAILEIVDEDLEIDGTYVVLVRLEDE